MIGTSIVIVVDTDAIIALANQNDIHHQTAANLSEHFKEINAQLVYPITAVAEANSYIQRVLSNKVSAYEIAQAMIDPEIEVTEVNKENLGKALEYFSPTATKKNTLFDCIVAAVAEENSADAIFSFDKFYQKIGFKLASELK